MENYITPSIIALSVLFFSALVYWAIVYLLFRREFKFPKKLKVSYLVAVFLLAFLSFLLNSPLEDAISEKLLSYIIFAMLAVLSYFAIEVLDVFIVDYYLITVNKVYVFQPLRKIIFLVLYVLVLIVLLNTTIKINLLALVAIPTVLTAGLAFALQDTIKKFLAGIVLGRVLKEGDWISFSGHDGKIIKINWAYLTVKSFDGDHIIIPTNNVVSNEVYKYGGEGIHRCTLPIGTSYKAPPLKVKETLLGVIRNIDGILPSPAPKVFTMSFGDFAITYNLIFWISDFSKKREIIDEVNTRIWYAFKREDIEIPFPIRTIINSPPVSEKTSTDEIAEFLKKTPIFSGLSENLIKEISERFKTKIYLKDEVVIKQATAGESFFVLANGGVKVYLEDELGMKPVANLGPGDYFGEMSLLTGEPCSATVIADEKSTFYIIEKDDFKEIIQKNPSIAEILAKNLISKKQELLKAGEKKPAPEKEVEMSGESLKERIKKFFKIGP